MPSPPLRPVNARKQISLRGLRQVAEQAARSSNVFAAGGITAGNSAGGIRIQDSRPREIWAEITGSSGAAHAWTQKVETSSGTWADLEGGLEGTTTVLPAYEPNGNTVATGTLVKMTLNHTGESYRIEATGSESTITVKEEDGSPSVAASTIKFPNTTVTDNGDGSASIETRMTCEESDGSPTGLAKTLRFNQATGLGFSTVSSSVAIGYLIAATASQQGAVTTSAQTFGGEKTFSNNSLNISDSVNPTSGLQLHATLPGDSQLAIAARFFTRVLGSTGAMTACAVIAASGSTAGSSGPPTLGGAQLIVGEAGYTLPGSGECVSGADGFVQIGLPAADGTMNLILAGDIIVWRAADSTYYAGETGTFSGLVFNRGILTGGALSLDGSTIDCGTF